MPLAHCVVALVEAPLLPWGGLAPPGRAEGRHNASGRSLTQGLHSSHCSVFGEMSGRVLIDAS